MIALGIIALATLAASGREFTSLFRHGTLEVEIYRPDRVDRQTPHTRDELYVVISGTGLSINGVGAGVKGVALVMDRLALIPWVSGVSLSSASRQQDGTATFDIAAGVSEEH